MQVALKNILPSTVCTRVYVCVYVLYDNGALSEQHVRDRPHSGRRSCVNTSDTIIVITRFALHTRPPHSSAIIVSTRCVCTIARTRLYYKTVVRGNNAVKSSNARHGRRHSCFRFRAKNGREIAADRHERGDATGPGENGYVSAGKRLHDWPAEFSRNTETSRRKPKTSNLPVYITVHNALVRLRRTKSINNKSVLGNEFGIVYSLTFFSIVFRPCQEHISIRPPSVYLFRFNHVLRYKFMHKLHRRSIC